MTEDRKAPRWNGSEILAAVRVALAEEECADCVSRPVYGALIDGEAVVLRNVGRSDFGALMIKRGGAQVTFAALRRATACLRSSPFCPANGANRAGFKEMISRPR